jgi:hypothetical protein
MIDFEGKPVWMSAFKLLMKNPMKGNRMGFYGCSPVTEPLSLGL